MVPTFSGVFAFLLLLTVAVQVVFDLYATSAVTAAAYDAARVVAGSDGSAPAAEADARRALGTYGQRVRFEWTVGPDAVVLRVRAENPGFVPRPLRRPLGADAVDRTVRVRVERLR